MPGTVLNILRIIHVILIELATVIMDTWNKRRGLNPSCADSGDLRGINYWEGHSKNNSVSLQKTHVCYISVVISKTVKS